MSEPIEWHPNGTPGPWYIGAQNDMLYVVAGRMPAPSNDDPWPVAPRVVVARIFGPTEGDCLPVCEQTNGRAFIEVPAMVAVFRRLNSDEIIPISEIRAILARIDGELQP